MISTDAARRLSKWDQLHGYQNRQARHTLFDWAAKIFEGPVTASMVYFVFNSVGLNNAIAPNVETVETHLEDLEKDGLLVRADDTPISI